MVLLNVYDDKDEATYAEKQLSGPRRLASERDDNKVIYNLFGVPTWGNFLRLNLFNLAELKLILEAKSNGANYDKLRHASIVGNLKRISDQYHLEIPAHWL